MDKTDLLCFGRIHRRIFYLINSEWQKLRTALLSWVNLFHRKLLSLPRLVEKLGLQEKSNQEKKTHQVIVLKNLQICASLSCQLSTIQFCPCKYLNISVFLHCLLEDLKILNLADYRVSFMNRQKLSSSCCIGDSNSCPPDLELGGGGGGGLSKRGAMRP
jgi:hypothetical protein